MKKPVKDTTTSYKCNKKHNKQQTHEKKNTGMMVVLVLDKSISLQQKINVSLSICRLPSLSLSYSRATSIVFHLMFLIISLLLLILTTPTTTAASSSSSKLYLSSMIPRKFQKRLLLHSRTSTRASSSCSNSQLTTFLPKCINHNYEYSSHRILGFHTIPYVSSNTYSFLCNTNRNNHQRKIRFNKPNFLQSQQIPQQQQQQQLTSRSKMSLLFSSKVDTNESNEATTNPTSTTTTTTILETPPVIPRAAVSIVLRYTINENENESNDDSIPTGTTTNSTNYYLLIRRGKPPSMGLWSFPGGKIEYGETTMNGAKRELMEEVQVLSSSLSSSSSDDNIEDTTNILNWNDIIQWYPEPVMTTDTYGDGYHYLIAQCYGEVTTTATASSEKLELLQLPKVIACDDAKDAKWFTLQEIQQMASNNSQQLHVVIGAPHVIQRIEQLSKGGMLLPCP